MRGYLEFDYIIDAANVAYYNQNDVGGRFSFQQLDLLVKKLRTKSNRILLVISSLYTGSKIHNSITGQPHMMTPYERVSDAQFYSNWLIIELTAEFLGQFAKRVCCV